MKLPDGITTKPHLRLHVRYINGKQLWAITWPTGFRTTLWLWTPVACICDYLYLQTDRRTSLIYSDSRGD